MYTDGLVKEVKARMKESGVNLRRSREDRKCEVNQLLFMDDIQRS